MENINPNKKCSKLLGLLYLKVSENKEKSILVFCRKPKDIQAEFADKFYELVDYSSIDHFIKMNAKGGLNQVYFCDIEEDESDALCGVRGCILLIEGARSKCPEKTLKETIMPCAGVVFNPTLLDEVSYLISEEIPEQWVKRPELIFSERDRWELNNDELLELRLKCQHDKNLSMDSKGDSGFDYSWGEETIVCEDCGAKFLCRTDGNWDYSCKANKYTSNYKTKESTKITSQEYNYYRPIALKCKYK